MSMIINIANVDRNIAEGNGKRGPGDSMYFSDM